MNITLRQRRPEDAQRGGVICYEAFKAIAEQHNFPPDFPSAEVSIGVLSSLLARRDIYSVVAELDGQLVGSGFLWENATISSVGPGSLAGTSSRTRIPRRFSGNFAYSAAA